MNGAYDPKTAPAEHRAALLLLVARRMVPGQYLDFDVDMWVQSCIMRWKAYGPMVDFVVPGGLLVDLQVAMSQGLHMVDRLAEQSPDWLRQAGWLNPKVVQKAIGILLNPHLHRYIGDKVRGLTPDEAFSRVMGETEEGNRGQTTANDVVRSEGVRTTVLTPY